MDYAYKPTTHGLAVMAACMALEKPFHITRVAFGKGKVDEETNLADVHELLEYVADGTIVERSHQDERFALTIQYANSDHPDVKLFLLSEFIVFVEDPMTGEETDLLYGALGDYCQPVPAYNAAFSPSVFNFPLTLILSNELHVDISAPAGLVTWNDLTVLVNGMTLHQMDITIPADGWVQGGDGTYPFYRDIPVDTATEQMIPSLTVLEEGESAVLACGLAPRVQTLNGALRVFAVSVPLETIPASLTLQGVSTGSFLLGESGGGYTMPMASADTLGGVKIGENMSIDEDGVINPSGLEELTKKDVFTAWKEREE